MGKTRKKTKEKTPNSIFKKLEINSITDIIELYLFLDLTQENVNNFATECFKFLHEKHNVSRDLGNQFNVEFTYVINKKQIDYNHIRVAGNNLLTSLWIIGVYPKNPEKLVNKNIYKTSDFEYRYYTKNKNLTITKPITNERKLTNNP